ncbi:LacI family DNA-binding transcriptional regulator [Flagellimonas flava]|uniref:LacI family transcriptional regulator n=1 Tax=Flagellimonas flava TaxID=570519 RepID=A0A1M5NRN2_9FLAO|nr:LacI family DNA-binding transcriptional regulator [Allomuricauda flava]SHG92137.1 LacI family transcriptional regulator [Allomuricauda flava]
MHPKKYTLQDIAELAQVSRGTVDRVVNNRGKVSAKAKEKVEKVLKEIDYKPNLIARSLKRHKNLAIAVVIPQHNQHDVYWDQCAQGIQEAGKKWSQFGIELNYFYYQKSKESFVKTLMEAWQTGPNAILMAPIYYEELKWVFPQIEQLDIPIGFINTPIEEVDYLTFVGQDYKKSGRLAAQLMENLIKSYPPQKILIAHIGVDTDHAIHLHDKEKGFREYFAERIPDFEIETISFRTDNVSKNLDSFMSDFAGVYVTTSKTHLLSEYLSSHPKIKVIGYDLVPRNIELLRKGTINMLLNQNPKMQGHACIDHLSNHLLYNIAVDKKKLFPIDIVLTENLPSYL